MNPLDTFTTILVAPVVGAIGGIRHGIPGMVAGFLIGIGVAVGTCFSSAVLSRMLPKPSNGDGKRRGLSAILWSALTPAVAITGTLVALSLFGF
jgi:hypothetical protein